MPFCFVSAGIVHNPDAIDYEDEAEVLEDDEPAQRPQLQHAPMHAPKPFAVDEDIDFDAPQDNYTVRPMAPAAAPVRASPLVSVGAGPQASALLTIGGPSSSLISVQTLGSNPQQSARPAAIPGRPPGPLAAPARVKPDPKYFSAVNVPGGPALKFTDMFHGVMLTTPVPKNNRSDSDRDAMQVVEGDIDEYEIFDEPVDETDPLWIAANAPEAAESRPERSRGRPSGFTLFDEASSRPQTLPAIPKFNQVNLEPVQHMYWENDIIWEGSSGAVAQPLQPLPDVHTPVVPVVDEEDEMEVVQPAHSSIQSSQNLAAALFPESVSGRNYHVHSIEVPSWASQPTGANGNRMSVKAEPRDDMDVDAQVELAAGASLRDMFLAEDQAVDIEDMAHSSIPPIPTAALTTADFAVEAPPQLERAVVDMNDADLVFEEIGASETTEMDSVGSDNDQSDVDEPPAAAGAVGAENAPAEGAEGEAPKRKKRRHLQLPGRPISAAELQLRRRQEALKKLDRFNLSNDKYYLSANVAQKVRTEMKLRHSSTAYRIALAKTKHSQEELLSFHKPRVAIKHNQVQPISLGQQKGKKSRDLLNLDVMRHKKDLSAREGRVVLTEYVEELPPLLMMVGMASHLRSYYRKVDEHDVHAESRLAGLDGDIVSLEPTESSPFLGDIRKGTYVQSFENDLFKAPVFKHDVSETDFLLVRYGDKNPKWIIREVSALYTVGQEQPLAEVPAPNSRQSQTFITKRLGQYIFNLFGPKKQTHVKITDVAAAFPLVSDNALRRQLKGVAEFNRGGDDAGSWYPKGEEKKTDQQIRDMVTLEEICAFDSMLAGQERLQKLGIRNMTNVSPQLTQAVQSIPLDLPIREAVVAVEQELQLTPWNLTSNYLAALTGQGLLQLSGFGDPSGRGEAFSYLRMALKIPPKKSEDKEKEEKVIVHQTDADLRKLTLAQARQMLRDWNVPEETIMSLKRWRVVGMIRELSNKLKESGEGTKEENKFARGNRHSVLAHQQQYNEKCQSIFDNQIQALSNSVPQEVEVELDDEFGGLLDTLDTALSVPKPGEKKNPARALRQLLHGRPEERESAQDLAAERDAMEKALENMSAPASQVPPSESSNEPPAAPQPTVRFDTEKHAVYYVKKTHRRADGTSVTEIIKDKISVDEYLKKHSYKDPKDRKPTAAAKRAGKDGDEKKEKKRRTGEGRRRSKAEIATSFLRDAMESIAKLPGFNPDASCPNCRLRGHSAGTMLCPRPDPFDRPPVPETDVDIAAVARWKAFYSELSGLAGFKENSYCSACRFPGHLKTNKICPAAAVADLGGEPLDEPDDTPRPKRAATTRKRPRVVDEDEEEDDDAALDAMMFGGEDDEGAPPRKRVKSSAPRRGPQSRAEIISKGLRPALMAVYQNPDYEVFRTEPDKSEFPDYNSKVSNPTWTAKIRTKMEKKGYTEPEQILSEIQLIRDNCHLYNREEHPMMLPHADHFLQDFKDQYDLALPALVANLATFEEAKAAAAHAAANPVATLVPKPEPEGSAPSGDDVQVD